MDKAELLEKEILKYTHTFKRVYDTGKTTTISASSIYVEDNTEYVDVCYKNDILLSYHLETLQCMEVEYDNYHYTFDPALKEISPADLLTQARLTKLENLGF